VIAMDWLAREDFACVVPFPPLYDSCRDTAN